MTCVQFYWTRRYSQKPNDVCNKMLCLALEYFENCRSGVSFVPFGCLARQILVQKLTKFDCVCITDYTRQSIGSCCVLRVFSFHVPCFAV